MLSRGKLRIGQLIARNGGVYSVNDVAQMLGKTADDVMGMVHHRELVGFCLQGDWILPAAQFQNNRLVTGVRDVLAVFPPHVDLTTMTLFFLSTYERTDRTPLALLGDGVYVESLMESARSLCEHGAR